MVSPKLYVVFYRLRYGNYQHWGLYLDDKEPLIFEVIGEHPKFKHNIVTTRPEKSRSFLQKLYIGVISKDDIETVKQAAETVPVDNETVEWDYECILESDEDYRDAREILGEKRGAIL
ncbi:uncharacterized protein ASPGLDRAFT_66170 [Aspergillus glaucus CBS 516.65]|uniref:Uncharacterized protein n=1 Tax=Aspergillus glaucus CBS 516.65 TaxID=1160497 RepID=A0A1L9VL20_ASPGL|nr:hypothetical protein ASPGLDRAFT_66170 [Aspergillus glaucus CBS 516.65]OJJ84613.1 hypothetical protein ASPGLDRAFT_66170 [Aspergillus glaucus CBS 516.65]